jgi:hypothetical protein
LKWATERAERMFNTLGWVGVWVHLLQRLATHPHGHKGTSASSFRFCLGIRLRPALLPRGDLISLDSLLELAQLPFQIRQT